MVTGPIIHQGMHPSPLILPGSSGVQAAKVEMGKGVAARGDVFGERREGQGSGNALRELLG